MPKDRRSRKSRNAKPIALLIGVGLVSLLIAILVTRNTGSDSSSRSEQLVRPDSQRLSVAPTQDVFVEFLDFECEACRAAFPTVEELRKQYGTRVTFVVRYMPLHVSSNNAARAAEAAAAQGKFEQMYAKLFETQQRWGEKQFPQDQVFFDLAQEVGLNMTQFRTVFRDPATTEKLKRDEKDGKALGVDSTPTFFLNGNKVSPDAEGGLASQFERVVNS